MTRLAEILRRLQEDLGKHQAQWALVGGLAVSARAEPRFTRDVDVAVVAADDRSAESLVFSLQRSGYRVLAVVEQTHTGRIATARLIPPKEEASGIVVNLLLASSGIEPEMVRAAEILELLEGLEVPVCATAHLLVAKLLSRDNDSRPQDSLDISALSNTMTPTDWQEARRAATLIEKRRFNRGRDLIDLLNALMRSQTKTDQAKNEAE
ncbi:MAG: hypothetical protein CME06_15960 [Gemmatimonadetes bacterium]|nr:hypothetical protein [Gemmatimonadota bacterium]